MSAERRVDSKKKWVVDGWIDGWLVAYLLVGMFV